MQKEEAIAWFGSQRKLANFLGVAQSNVSAWKNIPKHHQKTIQEHTEGQLSAIDNTKKQRYMCTIEQIYIAILKDHAHMLGIPMVEVLRRAIKQYAEKHTLKKK
jgi:DNA-binding transcriptional regulator YdaS (Cro superfamily)